MNGKLINLYPETIHAYNNYMFDITFKTLTTIPVIPTTQEAEIRKIAVQGQWGKGVLAKLHLNQ
jgi:hypothetical protein